MEVCAAPAFLPLPSPQGPSTPFALGALFPCGPLKLGRPQAVEFPGRRWELRGGGGSGRGSHRPEWPLGPSTSRLCSTFLWEGPLPFL